jgi:hypothetical protein
MDKISDFFIKAQDSLKKVFVDDGYSVEKSQELSFLIVQGIRDVPVLIELLENIENHQTVEILDAVFDVLVNRRALDKAYNILISGKS